MKVLVTGGLGYIGSHTVCSLIENNDEVVVIDNLSNSKISVIDSLKSICGVDIKCYIGDVCDKDLLRKIFSENKIDGVIHFAGYKAVGESCSIPLKYYRNNLDSTINLLEVMEEFGVYNLVFSSSATVYGFNKELPFVETMPTSATNPYGRTKLMIEEILTDLYKADNKWNITILRYFNPIGASKSGLIGEDPNDIPNNLMPYIVKVCFGELEVLNIYGNDYDTVDGTGVRDYIHVLDLSYGHVLALDKCNGLNIYNLGTGKGTSVLELVNTFERVNNCKVNYRFTSRRSGDIAECYASTDKAFSELGFKCKYNIEDMCRDSYNFVKKNTNK